MDKSDSKQVELAASIIDELLVLFDLYKEDYHIVREALEFIAKVRKENPTFPITISLSNHMRLNKLID